ncbi:MAG: GNAT family N-acetyltransferase [Planctomycetota bacterium]|nr:GNAT family N-acetyltransferase [Planctomycetota bacterium]
MEPTREPWRIRSFIPADLPACRRLYHEGLAAGKIAENDTGLDIDDIEHEYMRRPGNHFWVAEDDQGSVVGMIGVQHYEEGMGTIRRLRVAQSHRRRGIGSALLESALEFCGENQYLKVTLDTFVERDPAIQLFVKFRFRHDRTRVVSGKELMYFYLDLYSRGPRENRQDEDFTDPGILQTP